jgi:hypothetical protein
MDLRTFDVIELKNGYKAIVLEVFNNYLKVKILKENNEIKKISYVDIKNVLYSK